MERGYKDYVLQRIQWPSIDNGKGFLISAYTDERIAQEHAFHLDDKEGKAVHIPNDIHKIEKLLEVNSGYRIFLN